MNNIEFLHQAAQPPPLKKPPEPLIGRCAFTGEPITDGYPVKQVISTATAELADTFRYPSEFVSVQFAELFRAQTLLRGNLLFLYDELLQPMISKESAAKQIRPCWRDLIHELPIGTPTVAVITDESKRRLWHGTQQSAFGEKWKPFFNGSVCKAGKTYKAPSVSRSLSIDVFVLRQCLELIETVQSHGFSKRGIYECILDETKSVTRIGMRNAFKLEDNLRKWRGQDEFALAVFIAQGKPTESPKTTNRQQEQLSLFP